MDSHKHSMMEQVKINGVRLEYETKGLGEPVLLNANVQPPSDRWSGYRRRGGSYEPI